MPLGPINRPKFFPTEGMADVSAIKKSYERTIFRAFLLSLPKESTSLGSKTLSASAFPALRPTSPDAITQIFGSLVTWRLVIFLLAWRGL